jgi:hypothetical protein
MKPIEPGCLCVVIRSFCGHQGKTLTVIKQVDQPTDVEDISGQWWETDKDLSCSWDSSPCWPESYLMRIDGHEPETQDVPEELTA